MMAGSVEEMKEIEEQLCDGEKEVINLARQVVQKTRNIEQN